jgi:hypothetical protein
MANDTCNYASFVALLNLAKEIITLSINLNIDNLYLD